VNPNNNQFWVSCRTGTCIQNPNYPTSGCGLTVLADSTSTHVSNPCSGAPPLFMAADVSPSLNNLATNNVNYTLFPDTTKVLADMDLIYQVWGNDTITMNNPVIHNFYDSLSNSSLGKLMALDTLMKDTNMANLANILTEINATGPANNIEHNMKKVEQIYVNSRLFNHGALSPGQLASLQTIANKCPFEDGNAVYEARVMLFPYQPLRIYEDYCGHSNAVARKLNPNNDSTQGINVNIYPNPNKGSFTLDYQLGKNQTGKVYIYTMTGIELGEYVLSSDLGKMPINNTSLSNGVYFYKVVTTDNTTRIGKIVIIK